MKRQFLSILAALAMSASLCPASAFAEEEPDDMQEEEAQILTDEIQTESSVFEADAAEEPAEAENEAEFSAGESNAVVPYLDENGRTNYAEARGLAFLPDVEDGVIEEGWYLASGSYQFVHRLTIHGNVNIILADDCCFEMKEGIHLYRGSGANLSIYAQSAGEHMGRMTCTGRKYEAGIGGNDDQGGGALFIYGGDITSYGGVDALQFRR